MANSISLPSNIDRAVEGEITQVRPKGTVRIILEENENIPPGGQFVGVQGEGYILQPGVEVDVPEAVLGVLDIGVMSVPIVDPQSRRVLGYRDRRRLPYRIVP